ncbi:MAG: efflux RND transporter periplasmic adaptor subunit [Nannocystales bacterium]
MSDVAPSETPSIFRRVVGFATPVAFGVVAFVMMQRAREEPPRRPPSEQGKAVRTAGVIEAEAIPRAVGYGVVRSSREWSLVAEVSGRVVELNDKLEDGRIIREGERLIKIDPAGFELSASQQKATVSNVKAQLSELAVREKNTKASLAIAKRSLELSEKELARVKKLESSGTASSSEVDSAEVSVLTQRQSVQSYKSTLAQIPAQRRAYKAQISQYEAGVKTAELDVARTEIFAPFDVRIRSADVELSELVTVGAKLAEGDGIALAEVPAQFSIGSLMPLIAPPKDVDEPPAAAEDTPETPSDEALSARALARRSAQAGLKATVTLESGAVVTSWEAAFDRFANVESATRTVSVVVAVDDPFGKASRGRRPPLVSGMYVEVELEGLPRPGCLAVPRGALRSDTLHVVDAQQRLAIRPVEVAFVQETYACIDSGVKAGDQVVLTDVVPAIEGTLLEPRVDERAVAQLAEAVDGEAQAQ